MAAFTTEELRDAVFCNDEFEGSEEEVDAIETFEDAVSLLNKYEWPYVDLGVLRPTIEKTKDVEWYTNFGYGTFGFCSMEGAPLYVTKFVDCLISNDAFDKVSTVGDVRTFVTNLLSAMVCDDDCVYGIRNVNTALTEYFVRLWLAVESKVTGDKFVAKYGDAINVEGNVYVSNWALYMADRVDDCGDVSMSVEFKNTMAK